MGKATDLTRRRVLQSGAAIAAGTFAFRADGFAAEDAAAKPAAKPLPGFVSWKDPHSVIVHSASTIETKRTAFGTSVVTPSDRLYIRNNLPTPPMGIVENRDAWELAVSGVRQPRTLTLAELK